MNEKRNAVSERLTPDESAVDAAVTKAMETKVKPFPVKRALALAASLVVVAATTLVVAAVMNGRMKTAADSAGSFEQLEMDEWIDGYEAADEMENGGYAAEDSDQNYGSVLSDPQTAADGFRYSDDGSTGSSKAYSYTAGDHSGVDMRTEPIPEGVGAEPVIVSDFGGTLTVTPVRAGFDGEQVTIVFNAEFSGETDAESYYFSPEAAWNLYEGGSVSQAEFTVGEREAVLTDSFVLLRDTEEPNVYSGFMTFSVESEKDYFPVHISLPFLIARSDDGESVGERVLSPDVPIQFDFTVTRTDG